MAAGPDLVLTDVLHVLPDYLPLPDLDERLKAMTEISFLQVIKDLPITTHQKMIFSITSSRLALLPFLLIVLYHTQPTHAIPAECAAGSPGTAPGTWMMLNDTAIDSANRIPANMCVQALNHCNASGSVMSIVLVLL